MIVTVGSWAVHFAFVGWLLFTALYATMAPWWRSSYGRNVLALAAVLAVTLGLVSVQLLLGVRWPAREWVRLTVFAAVAAVGWWRLFILLTDQIFAVRQPMPEAARRLGATHRAVCGECGK
jgi:hypothetical protein